MAKKKRYSNMIANAFGAKDLVEYAGTQIAKRRAPKEHRQYIQSKGTGRQAIKSAGNLALNIGMLAAGGAAGGAAKAAKTAKAAKVAKGAKTARKMSKAATKGKTGMMKFAGKAGSKAKTKVKGYAGEHTRSTARGLKEGPFKRGERRLTEAARKAAAKRAKLKKGRHDIKRRK